MDDDDDDANVEDDESNSDEDERRFLERFLKKRRQHRSRKKQTNALVLEARQLINKLQHGVPRKLARKRSLKGGAIGLENTSRPNAPPKKKKKAENPLKKELSNPQGLDFANQAGALMAQPQRVKMLPPKDMTKEAARPEKTMSGMKNKSTKVLR